MDELTARVAALEQKVFGMGYDTARKLVSEAEAQVTTMTASQKLDLLNVLNPDLNRAREIIQNVRRHM